MMKRYTLQALIAVNLFLALVLATMWFTPEANLRNSRWSPPAPRTTDFAGMLPTLPGVASADTSQFIAMLDRPLFSPTRRPPPPPPPPQAEAPVDNLSTATISGVYSGGGQAGVIMSIAGKSRRVQQNQAIEGWILKSIQGRSATFSRGGETRVLQLPKATLTTYMGQPLGGNASQARDAAAPGAGTPPQGDGATARRPVPRAVFGGSR